MKKLTEMTNSELTGFVLARRNCDSTNKDLFSAPTQRELVSERNKRVDRAAPICGQCIVKPACLEIAKRSRAALGSIYGGMYFGTNKAINISTKEEFPKKDILGDHVAEDEDDESVNDTTEAPDGTEP